MKRYFTWFGALGVALAMSAGCRKGAGLSTQTLETDGCTRDDECASTSLTEGCCTRCDGVAATRKSADARTSACAGTSGGPPRCPTLDCPREDARKPSCVAGHCVLVAQ